MVSNFQFCPPISETKYIASLGPGYLSSDSNIINSEYSGMVGDNYSLIFQKKARRYLIRYAACYGWAGSSEQCWNFNQAEQHVPETIFIKAKQEKLAHSNKRKKGCLNCVTDFLRKKKSRYLNFWKRKIVGNLLNRNKKVPESSSDLNHPSYPEVSRREFKNERLSNLEYCPVDFFPELESFEDIQNGNLENNLEAEVTSLQTENLHNDMFEDSNQLKANNCVLQIENDQVDDTILYFLLSKVKDIKVKLTKDELRQFNLIIREYIDHIPFWGYYVTDIENCFNCLTEHTKTIFQVSIPQNAAFRLVENRHNDGVSNYPFRSGYMCSDVRVEKKFQLDDKNDINSLIELELFDNKSFGIKDNKEKLFSWFLKNHHIDLFKNFLSYADDKVDFGDLTELALKAGDTDTALLCFNRYVKNMPNEYGLQSCFKKAYLYKQNEFAGFAFSMINNEFNPDQLIELGLLSMHTLFENEQRARIKTLLTKTNYKFILAYIKVLFFKGAIEKADSVTSIYLSGFKAEKHLYSLIETLAPFGRDELLLRIFQEHSARFSGKVLEKVKWLVNIYELPIVLPEMKAIEPVATGLRHSSLTSAVEKGNINEIKRLILSGADIDTEAYKGAPLITACKLGYVSIVRILLDAGANPDPWVGQTIKIANKYNFVKIKKLLLEYGVEDRYF